MRFLGEGADLPGRPPDPGARLAWSFDQNVPTADAAHRAGPAFRDGPASGLTNAARLPGGSHHRRGRTPGDRQAHVTDNRRFFVEPLPGHSEPLGHPGGATETGPFGADTELVAAHPTPPVDQGAWTPCGPYEVEDRRRGGGGQEGCEERCFPPRDIAEACPGRPAAGNDDAQAGFSSWLVMKSAGISGLQTAAGQSQSFGFQSSVMRSMSPEYSIQLPQGSWM